MQCVQNDMTRITCIWNLHKKNINFCEHLLLLKYSCTFINIHPVLSITFFQQRMLLSFLTHCIYSNICCDKFPTLEFNFLKHMNYVKSLFFVSTHTLTLTKGRQWTTLDYNLICSKTMTIWMLYLHLCSITATYNVVLTLI